jgi:hypothetical protein
MAISLWTPWPTYPLHRNEKSCSLTQATGAIATRHNWNSTLAHNITHAGRFRFEVRNQTLLEAGPGGREKGVGLVAANVGPLRCLRAGCK